MARLLIDPFPFRCKTAFLLKCNAGEEIREELISVLSKNGGTRANLGSSSNPRCITCLRRRDQFVFDVSHQAYVHKLLTGRREQFHSIRTPGGLNGFMLRTESRTTATEAGTRYSAVRPWGWRWLATETAATSMGLRVAGDAAFTCGIYLRSAEQYRAPHAADDCWLNDNEWSIDKKSGHRKLPETHRHEPASTTARAGRIGRGKVGGKRAAHGRKAEEAAKHFWPSVIFEELGLKYYGRSTATTSPP